MSQGATPPPRHPDTSGSRQSQPHPSTSSSVSESAAPATTLEQQATEESTEESDARLAAALAQLEAEQSPPESSPSAAGSAASPLPATATPTPSTSAPPAPPPRHPSVGTARSRPAPDPGSAAEEAPPPLEPPPIRSRPFTSRSSSHDSDPDPDLSRKLEELQDLEIASLLDRVGHRLTDVRIAEAANVRLAVEYPSKDDFRAQGQGGGKVDWFSYLAAYVACLAAEYVPSSLVESTPHSTEEGHQEGAEEQEFSLRDLRDELERLYILCPPPIWQRLVLSELASLWRWDDPTRTLACFAGYLLIWWYDLLFLAPCAGLALLVVKARFFPPSKKELLRLSEDRQARSRDARVLSKQLKASSVVGYAGQGVKGLWSDWRGRFKDAKATAASSRHAEGAAEEEEADSRTSARAGAAVANGGESTGGDIELRQRSRSATTTPTSSITAKPDSALGHLLASSSILTTSTASPPAASSLASALPSKPQPQEEKLPDPARAPGGKEGDGDVSLYRLMRNLLATFGPNAILWLGEVNDLGERIKNLIVHPEHPSVRYVALRLLTICLVLATTPISLVYKTMWLYLGIDFFVMWKVRSTYPEWRGVTLPHRWLLLGAPNDVQYTLYALRQRQLEGKPIHGTKTLKRRAREADKRDSPPDENDNDAAVDNMSKMERTKARARALSSAVASVLEEADRYRSRRSSDFETASFTAGGGDDAASVVSLPRGKPEASYFALYSSKPGSLSFYSDRLSFAPARHLASLTRLSSRFSSTARAVSQLDLAAREDDDDASLASVGTSSSKRTIKSTLASVLAQGGEVVILYEEIEGVTKQTDMKAFEGLAVRTKDGRTYNFRNVSRRDDAFTKLLSFTAAKWKQR
ncbi:hypothetical protein JCM10908_005829 [Rhodotorula pacifica]|uniref:uncharacterized protein n=1 Tax=Rhodotorula pacifica TaxID=1495444 RepID=UPI00318231C4